MCDQTICLYQNMPNLKKKNERHNLDPKDLSMLNKYAALTYVPETDRSRLDGAGAGLNDND